MNYKQLKLFAMACMLFDHVTRIFPLEKLFLPLAVRLETAGHLGPAMWLLDDLPLYLAFIGRLAAPVFLFCIANGFFHTRDVRRYCGRILIAAVAAQAPYVLFDFAQLRLYGGTEHWWDVGLNILFTLALGLLAIAVYDRLSKQGRRLLGLLAVAAAALLARLLRMEGHEGYILMIFVFYLTRDASRRRRALAFAPTAALARWKLVRWMVTEWSRNAAVNCLLNTVGNYLGMLVTLSYNGEKGRAGRGFQWFAYCFYPGHLALLALIGFLRTPLV